tara:strand:+ start:828 stop:992 length:165 start_codon:yes stop_codon:yes gene_type:complete
MTEKEIYWSYYEFSGNLFINPNSSIEDQIFELLNTNHNIKYKYFDPSKIIIKGV